MTALYAKLSALMFMEFAIWGAWAPVLATRLLGPLKMSGKQTGWIYATLPLASMFSPLLAGQLADKYVDTGWILAAAHVIGAVLLFLAVRMQKFSSLFVVMLLYSFCYAATIPLVNALMFRHLTDPGTQSPWIFIWAPVAWALVGYLLTAWRLARGTAGDGSDCLVFAAVLSAIMAMVCLIQPATPPQGSSGTPILQALGMLQEPNFLVFILASLFVAGMMQFYFLGTAQFMQDMGISPKAVPASMAVAQAVQAAATVAALGWLISEAGHKWTLALGAASWLALYLLYIAGKPRTMIVAGQALHGLAYVFFIIAGQLFVQTVAPAEIQASAQALIILVTTGIGLFLGTQMAGIVMDRFSVNGRFQWRKIWMVPAAITLVGLVALLFAFQDPAAKAAPAAAPAAEQAAS